MAMEPPPFQEASRCDVCKCSFSTFRRRHHCRCCGRTLCAEHSADQMALPQFGIHTHVRVCANCFNNGSSLKKDGAPATPNEVNALTDSISRIDISKVSDNKPQLAEKSPFPGISECKCGMPLCICEAPAPSMDSVTPQPLMSTSNPPLHSPKVKKTEGTPKSRGSTSNNRQSTFFNPGQVASSSVNISSADYEATGEGLREAIKNGDTAAAKKLLSQAAVFNQTEIAFALMDHGASLDSKNSQGETPLDCAPATLQYRMKEKMQEGMQLNSSSAMHE
ncbi:hypothetical protein Salat_2599900 [Sesamum alatum]|uniref:FYVE-type domain-containing protein n=1 Tax=Sesamum alatum TaxID=300844 RepID=A0AAE1XNW1_9LAMI|nr:hypothetical protein Salat_2599900 [Sesamum alatum]